MQTVGYAGSQFARGVAVGGGGVGGRVGGAAVVGGPVGGTVGGGVGAAVVRTGWVVVGASVGRVGAAVVGAGVDANCAGAAVPPQLASTSTPASRRIRTVRLLVRHLREIRHEVVGEPSVTGHEAHRLCGRRVALQPDAVAIRLHRENLPVRHTDRL